MTKWKRDPHNVVSLIAGRLIQLLLLIPINVDVNRADTSRQESDSAKVNTYIFRNIGSR
jgi:hypothetical protein